WADLDGDQVVFMTSADTIKGKAILRDPRVSLCWDDERPPFSFVTIAGTAATSADAGDLVRWATRIGGRYMGADRAEEFGRRNGVPPQLVVRGTPAPIVAKGDSAGRDVVDPTGRELSSGAGSPRAARTSGPARPPSPWPSNAGSSGWPRWPCSGPRAARPGRASRPRGPAAARRRWPGR